MTTPRFDEIVEEGLKGAGQSPDCKVFRAVMQLPENEREGAWKIIADREVPRVVISEAFRAKNIRVGVSTVGRHRLSQCACFNK